MSELSEKFTVAKGAVVIWDAVLSLVVLVAGAIFLTVSAIIDLVTATLLSQCDATTCSAGAAVASLAISWFSMLVFFVVGAIVTVTMIIRRRRGWWIAVTAVVLGLASWIIGYVLFFQALHHGATELSGLVANTLAAR